MQTRKRLLGKQITRDTTVAEAATSLVAAACQNLEVSWHALMPQHPNEKSDASLGERVHRFRVAARQMRVVLHIFRAMDPAGDVAKSRSALAKIGQSAGRQRDLDVLLDDIVTPLQTGEQEIAVRALAEVLGNERDSQRHEIVDMLGSKAAQQVRRQLVGLPEKMSKWADSEKHNGSIGKFADRCLRHRWAKLERQAASYEKLDAAGRHEMRKQVKKLRYAFSCFAQLWEEDQAKEFANRVQRLQSAFGYLNDVENAKKLTDRVHTDASRPELAFAIGYVLGTHIARAEQVSSKIPKQWRRLAKTEIGRALAAD